MTCSTSGGSSTLDLNRDTVVAEQDGGALAGYALVRKRGTFGVVAPDCEQRGIGARLLTWCEGRQRELGWSKHTTAVAAGVPRAESLMLGRGYQRSWTSARLTLSLPAALPARVDIADVTLRRLDPLSDGQAVFGVDCAAFESAPSRDFVEFADRHLRAHDLDPRLSRVAESAGKTVGFALTRRWQADAVAYVSVLAVEPQFQHRGIGRLLLLDVLLAAQGARLAGAQLNVGSDNPKAATLYESLGMRPTFSVDIYERPVA